MIASDIETWNRNVVLIVCDAVFLTWLLTYCYLNKRHTKNKKDDSSSC